MVKVINGKRYNTDTAEEIYCHGNGRSYRDFGYRYKTLYRTKSGAWFLHHEGGAMTDMATRCGNSYSGGADIEAISEDDAYKFLEAHSDSDKAAKAISERFGDRVTDA